MSLKDFVEGARSSRRSEVKIAKLVTNALPPGSRHNDEGAIEYGTYAGARSSWAILNNCLGESGRRFR
jgi:hypothetical protein